jgi:hypothetical protein
MALPGDAAALRFHLDSSGAVMVHDPHAQTMTAVAHVTHPAFVLLSPDGQSQRVTGWSRVLAGLAASGTCARVQVLETALPDSGHDINGWWQDHGTHDPEQWAVREYDELMATAAPSASIHRTLIALVLDLKRAAKPIKEAGRGMTGAAAVLRQDMTSLEAALSVTSAVKTSSAAWPKRQKGYGLTAVSAMNHRSPMSPYITSQSQPTTPNDCQKPLPSSKTSRWAEKPLRASNAALIPAAVMRPTSGNDASLPVERAHRTAHSVSGCCRRPATSD